MAQLWQALTATMALLDFWSVVDIVIVAAIIYGVLALVRGTTASSVLYGLTLLLVAVAVVRSIPGLVVLNWLLVNVLPLLAIALLVIFQPELRRAMERLGRLRALFSYPLAPPYLIGASRALDEICHACRRLSERRQGALIVLARETGLQEYADTGVEVNGTLSAELLLTIFSPGVPLHDGAVIVQGDRILAAGCLLPLSDRTVDYAMGMRHRAALGITEVTDAVSVAVSEETGLIALANNGRLVRGLDEQKLRKALTVLLRPPASEPLTLWPRRIARWRHASKAGKVLSSRR